MEYPFIYIYANLESAPFNSLTPEWQLFISTNVNSLQCY